MEKQPLSRIQEAILLVMYKQHPLPMTQEQIFQKIAEDGLLEMSEEEFANWKKNIKSIINN